MNTQSQTEKLQLTQEQKEGVQMAYEQMLKYCEKIQEDQGMTRFSFFFGVLNLILTILIFAATPQYYWLVFVYKTFIIIPVRLYLGAQRKDSYYLADFCWVSVLLDSIAFVLFIFEVFPLDYEVLLMRIIFLFSNGPQGWASILFSNAMVFHSFMHNCSLFIHISPVLASYTIRWNYSLINELFPDLFPLKSLVYQSQYFDIKNCFWQAFGIYSIWWVSYALWMCFSGIKLPEKGQDTIFNWLYTSNPGLRKTIDGIAHKLFKKQKDMQTKTKILIYLFFHGLMVFSTMLWAVLCFEYKIIHQLFLLIIASSVIWQASGFYIYFTLNGPKRHLEKKFKDQIQPIKAKWEKKKLQ